MLFRSPEDAMSAAYTFVDCMGTPCEFDRYGSPPSLDETNTQRPRILKIRDLHQAMARSVECMQCEKLHSQRPIRFFYFVITT
jgi:hypothetical protein